MKFLKTAKRYKINLLFFLSMFLLNCRTDKKEIATHPVSKDLKKDTVSTQKIQSDDFHVFEIYPMENGEKYDIFISLSDIYTDSLAIPPDIIKNQKNMPFNELKHFELPTPYREKLFKGSKLRESDTLYLYNYKSDILEKFPLKDLKAVANLNLYTSEGEEIQDYYYMIGFQLHQTDTEENAMNRTNFSLAYFGSENPFNKNSLQSVQWKKVSREKFPVKSKHDTLQLGNVYHYQTGGFQYFLQDFIREKEVTERKLVVLQNGKTIFEKNYTLGEGAAFTPLNGIENNEYPSYQWTGNLFKGKPPVIFGFVSQSFGCSEITFLDKRYSEIYTNCDNRH